MVSEFKVGWNPKYSLGGCTPEGINGGQMIITTTKKKILEQRCGKKLSKQFKQNIRIWMHSNYTIKIILKIFGSNLFSKDTKAAVE